jgi:predicted transcriptional regulator
LRKDFGELEAAIMTCLWQRGQSTVSEVYKELATQRDLAYTTVKTVMERVSEKGYLSCNARQRAYVYTPMQSREAFMGQVSDTILNGFFQDFGAIIEAYLLEETVRQAVTLTRQPLDLASALVKTAKAHVRPRGSPSPALGGECAVTERVERL